MAKACRIATLNKAAISTALIANFRDFQDAINLLDAIVTHNTEDCVNLTVPILTHSELIQELEILS
ncbi:hypothetical protein [Aerosakkonema funiforme]|uniref:Uncharacterized protein n=1 Tax=Aerosakkonema funiforme FACHB-1375 TaxID=2949571 RepID=A0A926VH21_9CYAN|nr:hypothetical protein [Aerosakkonema funiforme]MBD2183751.1 hypothetical protein [Aerosakkonema funiforme FACHB-1375]